MNDLLSRRLLLVEPTLATLAMSVPIVMRAAPEVVVVSLEGGDEVRGYCNQLGASLEVLDFKGAKERVTQEGQALYASDEKFYGTLHPCDIGRIDALRDAIADRARGAIIASPLAVGNHVDHQLLAHAARRLDKMGVETWFYQDAPYCFPGQPDSPKLAVARLRAQIVSTMDATLNDAKRPLPLDELRASVEDLYGPTISSICGSLESFFSVQDAHYRLLGGVCDRLFKLRFR